MASKQLGKLRQWAGEVISSREKTVVSEEFLELEKDIELRRAGNERLFFASEAYHHALKKKKDNLALDDPEKLLPIDILGIVMITHGEQFGHDSTFGSSLVKLGRAHCKIATLQEAYALTFRDTYFASIEKFGDELKEYDQMRKRLESRRLSYDAALSKAEKIKNSKKEKDRKEAEEELEKAKARYEETREDVRAHMHLIQECEIDQMRELTGFLDVELDFVEKYVEVLREVKKDWPSISSVRPGTRKPDTNTTPIKSSLKRSTSTRSAAQSTAMTSDDEDDGTHPTPSRAPSRNGRADSFSSKSRPSRPSSRASRKRAESTGNGADDSKSEKSAKRMSLASWSMGSFGRKKKEKFANLDDDAKLDDGNGTESEDGNHSSSPVQSHKSFSGRSTSSKASKGKHTKSKSDQVALSGSSSSLPRIQKPPSMQTRKVMRALHDFSGSSDELSFKAGDEIIVVNEVLEGWWMGDINGRRGLFPVPYTEPVPAKPPLPVRPDLVGRSDSPRSNSFSSGGQSDKDGYRSSDLDDDDVYGGRPLAPDHSPFYGGGAPEVASIISDIGDNDDNGELLRPSLSHNTRTPPSVPVQLPSTNDSPYNGGTTPKKAPPPPPPRRSTTSLGPSSTPPIPPRRPPPFRSQSSSPGSLSQYIPTPTSSVSSHDTYDHSPFDSATELSGIVSSKRNPF
ncbi:bar domain-containing protein [Moniliophthora roreri]|nr:bar domain-containing protein [Moniliophthora roreri]